MDTAEQNARLFRLREEIGQLRATGTRVRYPEAVKKEVAAMRAAGVPAARLGAELKLAASQVHDWHRAYRNSGPQVFDVRPSAAPSAVAAEDGGIVITVGALTLTIACQRR